MVLLAGAEAISTARALTSDVSALEGAPDWSEQVEERVTHGVDVRALDQVPSP